MSRLRSDSWQNTLTGVGDATRDKRMGARLIPDRMTDEFWEELWVGNAFAKRFVELEPNEMTRKGRDLVVKDDDDDRAKEISGWVIGRREELGVAKSQNQALRWRKGFGGGAVIMGVDDGQKPDQPVNFKRIKNLRFMNPVDKRRLSPLAYYGDPMAPRYGEVAVWRMQPESMLGASASAFIDVHESRMLIFRGDITSPRTLQRCNGWGESGFVSVYRELADFGMSWDGISHLLTEVGYGVTKIKALHSLIGAGKGAQVIERARLLAMSRSVARTMLVDADGEDFKREAIPLGGLPEIMKLKAGIVAAVMDIPVQILMGEAPAGLNASGDATIRAWYDKCSGLQETDLKPQDDKVDKILLCSTEGPTKGKEPQKWHGKYRPLWQMTDKEAAEIREIQQRTDVGYVAAGVLLDAEVAASRFGGAEWSAETVIDLEARAALAKEEAERPDPPPAPGELPLEPASEEEPEDVPLEKGKAKPPKGKKPKPPAE